ncbi:hypothetical protein HPG69_018935 [Diceros bicornis minor]|uniref:Uncharacterized protein n=1 Tax=Diceros bicornis minor TaxID=77932 RepID=A0A7J7F9R6_DICBM|nr:hypothetical protein HPG69_018935 [Diceros bicornis minor]
MIVVSITYGSCIFLYVKPSAKERVTLSKGVAVLNTSVAPLISRKSQKRNEEPYEADRVYPSGTDR